MGGVGAGVFPFPGGTVGGDVFPGGGVVGVGVFVVEPSQIQLRYSQRI